MFYLDDEPQSLNRQVFCVIAQAFFLAVHWASLIGEVPGVMDETSRLIDEVPNVINKVPKVIDEAPKVINDLPWLTDEVPRLMRREICFIVLI